MDFRILLLVAAIIVLVLIFGLTLFSSALKGGSSRSQLSRIVEAQRRKAGTEAGGGPDLYETAKESKVMSLAFFIRKGGLFPRLLARMCSRLA